MKNKLVVCLVVAILLGGCVSTGSYEPALKGVTVQATGDLRAEAMNRALRRVGLRTHSNRFQAQLHTTDTATTVVVRAIDHSTTRTFTIRSDDPRRIVRGLRSITPHAVATVASGSMRPALRRSEHVYLIDQRWGRSPDRPIQTVEGSGNDPVFGHPGDVVAFQPPGRPRPILHRVHGRVSKGDDWTRTFLVEKTCSELSTCPAPYDGFITKGDANEKYDQVADIAPVVRPSWIRGVVADPGLWGEPQPVQK